MFAPVLASALAAAVLAAPPHPHFDPGAGPPGGFQTITDYFNQLAETVQSLRGGGPLPPGAPPLPGTCDLSNAQLPTNPTPLPGPSAGLTLKHVAVGRGTQNYTCDAGNATAAPVAVGALATLFNASCAAATSTNLLDSLPASALQFNLTGSQDPLPPTSMFVSGQHFFLDASTPFFDLDSRSADIGAISCEKNNTSPAPPGAPLGQLGEPAVAWLKLLARPGASGGLREVYRVRTAGGSPPSHCTDMSASFTVQYAAEYWFYEGQGNDTDSS